MKEVRSEIEICAPRELVWHVLTDFPSFPQWNPFVKHIEGSLVPGELLTIVVQAGTGPARTLQSKLLCVDPGQSLIWRGHPHVPGVVTSEHGFTLEVLPNGRTRFVHRCAFQGLLGSWFARRAAEHMNCGLVEMNRAIKVAAEWLAHPGCCKRPDIVVSPCTKESASSEKRLIEQGASGDPVKR
jgi:hypothetical protein